MHQTTAELQELHAKVSAQIGEDEAAIFCAHVTIAQDAGLSDKVRRLITGRQLTAAAALQLVLEEYEQLFIRVKDEYLKERLADLRDVFRRLARHTIQAEPAGSDSFREPVILVAHELLPSDVVTVSENQVLGIVTQSGGRTSHAAILARSYGIPAVAGVAGLLSRVTSGDTLVLDGGAGHVFVNPGARLCGHTRSSAASLYGFA